MPNNIKKAAVLIATLLLCAAAMTACADKTQELLAFVDKGEFADACEYYKEEIKGTNKEEDILSEFADEMEDRYEDITDMCFQGEYDEDDIEDLEDLLDDMDIDEDDYEEHYADWEAALESKRNYVSANRYTEEGDYEKAVEFLELIDERDINYDDAMELLEEYTLIMVENVLDVARVDIENGYYEDAVEILDYYREEYADNDDIMQKIEEYDILLGFELLRGYIENGDYNNALYYANEYMSKYSDDDELYSQASEAYQLARDSMNNVILSHIEDNDFYSASYYYSYADSYYTTQDFESLVAIVDEEVYDSMKRVVDGCFSDYEYSNVEDRAQELMRYFPECQKLSELCLGIEDTYVDMVISDAQALAQSGDYDSACELLSSALWELGDDNDAISRLYEEYLNASDILVSLEGVDISDRLTETECTDSSIYYRCGGWFMGSDYTKMETPFTYEELSQYEYLNIGYQVTYYEGEYLYPMFKVEHEQTYTRSDGTQDNLRTDFLCPSWMDYGPTENSADNRGETKNAEDVYKQRIDPSGTGILQIPTSVLLENMVEGDIINQFGIGHGGTIMDVGDDFIYEIYVTGATLS